MNKFWLIYFLFIIAYEFILVFVLNQKGYSKYTIADLFFVIFVIGLYGLAFRRRVISDKIWKVVFAISVIVFFHTWIVMPFVYRLSTGLTVSKIAYIQMFSIPNIPLFVALYVYAWRSAPLWPGLT
jgi:hypothetical protein